MVDLQKAYQEASINISNEKEKIRMGYQVQKVGRRNLEQFVFSGESHLYVQGCIPQYDRCANYEPILKETFVHTLQHPEKKLFLGSF